MKAEPLIPSQGLTLPPYSPPGDSTAPEARHALSHKSHSPTLLMKHEVGLESLTSKGGSGPSPEFRMGLIISRVEYLSI